MGLPAINIIFKEVAATAFQRGERGIVALILKDTNVPATNPFTVTTVSDIPTTLSEANKEQIQLALMGYIRPSRKVIVYVLPNTATDYTEAQNYLETVKWDYVAVPGIQAAETTAFATWIKNLRDTKNKKVKAVLPNTAADHEGIINFATQQIVTADKTYTTAEYCSRIAGMLAGTPLTISATFAPLPEVIDCDKLTKDEMDTAINQGKLILYNDGEKIKIARAVNSLVTTTQDKGESFKKIKIVDAMDMIYDDIKKTAEDYYIGKYANSYDNKCLLISAIQAYFDQLELDGILDKGKNSVGIDLDAQIAYLKSLGYDVDSMQEQEIKEANTRDKVFLKASIKILDAIEDITLNINI
ncbi:MAG: phage tail sheath subtilisin-like domain-containing protein [Thermovenabulum sp.]|uniref:phage tail sheath subtilisin-like domain-containing protein n=1 Tax=Thermovenabulum sp. TaxID=3100335 RepID=UPI003C7A72E4